MNERLAPVVNDPATRGYFEAAAQGRLVVSTCVQCHAHNHLPRPRCVNCGGIELRWEDVPKRGRVVSWTVVEHQVHPWFPVPYTIVIVEIDDCSGVRMTGYLEGRVEVGESTYLTADFEELGSDDEGNVVVLPRWNIEVSR
ncbi:Zn-ribbon domain-containing OB-fold protein [Rhodococcus sp. O3]|uniref:Zn-ribbon domain-containing OB-fold protein n=1 Tax=Rhodococcus sp. O3 TaxID=3404919 RepID=UPI003B678211